MRICLIDDEPIILKTLSSYLTDLGHSVICIASKMELEKSTADESLQLVIADLRLPGLNGMRLIRKVNRLFPNAAIVLISGHRADEITMRDIIENQAYAFLNKPFSLEKLESVLVRFEKERATGEATGSTDEQENQD